MAFFLYIYKEKKIYIYIKKKSCVHLDAVSIWGTSDFQPATVAWSNGALVQGVRVTHRTLPPVKGCLGYNRGTKSLKKWWVTYSPYVTAKHALYHACAQLLVQLIAFYETVANVGSQRKDIEIHLSSVVWRLARLCLLVYKV